MLSGSSAKGPSVDSAAAIPIMRPKLPPAEALLPYLREIDEGRWYSNFGPLLGRFQARLADHLDIAAEGIACVANGTMALTVGLMALGARKGSRCIMPAWTFVATPCAAYAAGLVPYFVDVDAETWAIDPDGARTLVGREDIGAVIPVAPFGAPIDRAAWDRFTEQTGIPVIVDAAAGFDTVARIPGARPGPTPIMISLHATKPFAVGEGGVLISTDVDFIARARRTTNFGFRDRSQGSVIGVNAKLTEYAAAVGLAGLDLWQNERASWNELTHHYCRRLAELPEISFCPGYGAGWISSYCNVVLPERVNPRTVIDGLCKAGIDTRRWWGLGCHRQPAFSRFPRTSLSVTEDLAPRVLGLPFWVDLNPSVADRVVFALADALKD